MNKSMIEFHLSRAVHEAEDAAQVDHEALAAGKVSYEQRRAVTIEAEARKNEAEALRAALEFIREKYPVTP